MIHPLKIQYRLFLSPLILCALTLFFTSCSSKEKKMESNSSNFADPKVSSDLIAEDPNNRSNQSLSYDPKGSDSKNLFIQSIHFNFDSSNLSSKAREILANNADWMKENSRVNIQIEGHCDERGSVEYNLALGERRAQAVKRYLVNLGIQDANLEVISYGEEKLLDDGDSEAAHQANRRVNFIILPPNE